MDMLQLRRRALVGPVGVLGGTAAGVAAVLGASAALALPHRQREAVSPRPIEATHLPPLLTASDEKVELRYDVYCGVADRDDESSEAECDPTGVVFVRTGDGRPFEQVPLRIDPTAAEGRYVASVPEKIAHSPGGFSYYAVFRGASGSDELTSPAGGASAPQRSLPLGRNVVVQLGAHAFGRTQTANARVAGAAWGDAPDEAGLEPGRTLGPTGGSSF